MKSLTEFISESLITESNDLWKQYLYCWKNMPKSIPFDKDKKVEEKDLVDYYKNYFKDGNISYDDVNGIHLIPFEQYVLSNWEDTRLLDMKLSLNQSNHMTTLSIEYGPVSTPRKSKGTTAKKEGHEFDIKDSENKPVDFKKWVHAIVTFLQNNIVNLDEDNK